MGGAATAALVLAASAAGVPVAHAAQATGADDTARRDADDWDELAAQLDSLRGVYTAPPANTTTVNYAGGPLIGNGNLGVQAAGTARTQVFTLSMNSFWNSRSEADCLPVAFGGITLRKPADGSDEGTGYEQIQDIRNSEIRSTLPINGATVTLRTWTADSVDVLVTEVTADRAVRLALDVAAKADNTALPAVSGANDGLLWASRETQKTATSQWVSRMAVATKLIGATPEEPSATKGTATAAFSVSEGQTVLIVSAFAGGFDATGHVADASGKAAALTASDIDALRAEHRAWWRDFWMAGSVQLGDPLMEQYFYGSLHALGCASRAGQNAPGLFGNWITTDNANWKADYHLNYNFQSPFYGVFAANRAELATPYFDAIDAYRPTGRAMVKAIKTMPAGNGLSAVFKNAIPADCRGVLFPVGIGPHGATTSATFWNQAINAGYSLAPYVLHYEYTRDDTFLSERLYPFLLELSDFWEDFLGQKGADGRYHLMGGAYEGDWAKDDAVSLGVARLVFASALRYSTVLGADADRRARWQDTLDNLMPYPTTTYQGKTVFNRDYTNTDFAPLIGRTICNLEWPFPLAGILQEMSAAECKTAVDTLDTMNAWRQGNNFAKIYSVAAHVGYPADVLWSRLRTAVQATLRQNLTCYNYGGGIESGAAVEAICAMLVAAEGGVIQLFPGRRAGAPARFDRLRAPGGFLISAAWDGKAVGSEVRLHSTAGGTAVLANPWPDAPMHVVRRSAGRVRPSVSGADSTYRFATQAGEDYLLLRKD